MKDKIKKFWNNEYPRVVYYIAGLSVGALVGGFVVYEKTKVINVGTQQSNVDEKLQDITLFHANGSKTFFDNYLIPQN